MSSAGSDTIGWEQQPDGGGVNSITTTSPIVNNGTAADPVIAIEPATTGSAGSMSAPDKTKLDGVAAGATATPLSATTPVAVGTATAGVGTTASRSDHVHAHGNQASGSLHADVVAGGASGFMSGSDKTKINALPSTLSLPLAKADGGFGQSVATGLTPGQGLYVDSAGVLQIGNVPVVFTSFISIGSSNAETAVFPGPSSPQSLGSVGAPTIVIDRAATIFDLTAWVNTVGVGDSVVIRIRKSSDQGATWVDLSTSVMCTIAAGQSSGSDSTHVGTVAVGDWVVATAKAALVLNNYTGGLRFKVRYN